MQSFQEESIKFERKLQHHNRLCTLSSFGYNRFFEGTAPFGGGGGGGALLLRCNRRVKSHGTCKKDKVTHFFYDSHQFFFSFLFVFNSCVSLQTLQWPSRRVL